MIIYFKRTKYRISDSVDSGKFKLSNKRLNNYLNEIDSKLMLEFPTGFPKDKIDS